MRTSRERERERERDREREREREARRRTVMTKQVLAFRSFANKIIIIIVIIIINCNWVVSRWQWLFYTYTKHEIGYY